jgi:integrase
MVMSIYPEKRNKKPTGRWIVDVVMNYKRHTARVKSFEEARKTEAAIRGFDLPPEEVKDPDEGKPYTLGRLQREVAPTLYRGNSDEEYDLARLATCVEIIGPKTPLTEVRYAALENLVEVLRNKKTFYGKHYTNKTINRYLSCMSKALRWAHKRDLILGMPAIPRQKEQEGRIAYLRDYEIPKFVEWIRDNERETTALCLETLMVTGMRVGELLSLDPDQVEQDADGNYFVILEPEFTKTRRSRTIPIPQDLGDRLIAMLHEKLPNYELLRQACLRASIKLKLKDTITPHILRHTCATILTAQGVPSLVVADLLGHSNLATTRRYAHPTRASLIGAMEVISAKRTTGTLQGIGEKTICKQK